LRSPPLFPLGSFILTSGYSVYPEEAPSSAERFLGGACSLLGGACSLLRRGSAFLRRVRFKKILLIQWLESHSSKVLILVQIRKRIKINPLDLRVLGLYRLTFARTSKARVIDIN
jgi:hypothetical protein